MSEENVDLIKTVAIGVIIIFAAIVGLIVECIPKNEPNYTTDWSGEDERFLLVTTDLICEYNQDESIEYRIAVIKGILSKVKNDKTDIHTVCNEIIDTRYHGYPTYNHTVSEESIKALEIIELYQVARPIDF